VDAAAGPCSSAAPVQNNCYGFAVTGEKGAKYCNKRFCMYLCLSARLHMSKNKGAIFTNFSKCIVSVARSFSSDDNAIRYVLPVLCMTSCLPVFGQAKETPTRHILKVTYQGQNGEKCDVYDCLAVSMYLLCKSKSQIRLR